MNDASRLTPIENLPEPHKTVASLIRVGKENATLLSDIMSIANIDERRTAYKVIEDLINIYGYAIVASKAGKQGYFYPANVYEFADYLSVYEQSITSMTKRKRNLIKNFNALGL